MQPSKYRYKPYPGVQLPERKWPSATLNKAPVWCSTDLRDGNQALSDPMGPQEKLAFFKELVAMGFKEIEIGYPSASEADFNAARLLIESGAIPDDVAIQVLAPARDELIARTFEAVEGAKNVIMHLYMNTSPFFRDVVYRIDKPTLIEMVCHGACTMRALAAQRSDGGAGVRFEFSPESFTETEPAYALEVCSRVLEEFGATEQNKLILNLPCTVERCLPNQFADRIEHFCTHLPGRERAVISVHTHNDRGTGVAATEMAVLAGAERVEGTLFGNGERTGNVDLITLALNLFTQGVDPQLDLSGLNRVKKIFEHATNMRVYERQPYTGELVFTAFSGTHQDAIKKGFDHQRATNSEYWDMPYLPVNPHDVGRDYEPIIRINSQSGKGGAAFLLRELYGYAMPTRMHPEFGRMVKAEADRSGSELSGERLLTLFLRSYCDINAPYRLLKHSIIEQGAHDGHSSVVFTGEIEFHGERSVLYGDGNGPIDAFFSAMQKAHIDGFTFASYHEHAISSGSDAKACAYIELMHNGASVFGVGIDENVSIASIKGVLSAVNRALLLDGVR